MSEAFRRLRELEIAEAEPQAPEATVAHLGVMISSRWSIAHELDRMRAIVTAMPQDVRERVETMWCDSNAQALYNVTIASGAWVEGIAHDVREAVLDVTDGFNGLVVEGDGRSVAFDRSGAMTTALASRKRRSCDRAPS